MRVPTHHAPRDYVRKPLLNQSSAANSHTASTLPAVVNDSTPEQSSRHYASGIALAVLGTFLFATKSIFIKLAFAAGVHPTPLLTLRLLFALPFYAVVFWHVRSRPDRKPLGRGALAQALSLGFLGYYLASYLDLAGLQYITAQLERVTLFVYPAIIAVLAWLFLGERLGGRVVIAILCCYVGVALMFWKEQGMTGGQHVGWGVTLVAAAAISYSVYVLFAKQSMTKIGSPLFTALAMIGSTGFVLIHATVTGEIAVLFSLPAAVYAYGFVLAILCTLLPSFMINEAIMRIGATRTAVIGSVGPVLTVLLAIAVLAEPSSPQHFAGMALAIAGVALVSRK